MTEPLTEEDIKNLVEQVELFREIISNDSLRTIALKLETLNYYICRICKILEYVYDIPEELEDSEKPQLKGPNPLQKLRFIS